MRGEMFEHREPLLSEITPYTEEEHQIMVPFLLYAPPIWILKGIDYLHNIVAAIWPHPQFHHLSPNMSRGACRDISSLGNLQSIFYGQLPIKRPFQEKRAEYKKWSFCPSY